MFATARQFTEPWRAGSEDSAPLPATKKAIKSNDGCS